MTLSSRFIVICLLLSCCMRAVESPPECQGMVLTEKTAAVSSVLTGV